MKQRNLPILHQLLVQLICLLLSSSACVSIRVPGASVHMFISSIFNYIGKSTRVHKKNLVNTKSDLVLFYRIVNRAKYAEQCARACMCAFCARTQMLLLCYDSNQQRDIKIWCERVQECEWQLNDRRYSRSKGDAGRMRIGFGCATNFMCIRFAIPSTHLHWKCCRYSHFQFALL